VDGHPGAEPGGHPAAGRIRLKDGSRGDGSASGQVLDSRPRPQVGYIEAASAPRWWYALYLNNRAQPAPTPAEAASKPQNRDLAAIAGGLSGGLLMGALL